MRMLHSRTACSIALGGFIVGFATPGVLGWGDEGHEMVATIAQIYTRPAVLQKLCHLLNYQNDGSSLSDDITTLNLLGNTGSDTVGGWPPCHLASIATWADKFKAEMLWSAPLHYVNAIGDNPPNTCIFPGSDGWAGKPGINILGGIYNTSSILTSFVDGKHTNVQLAQEALKFIVHFLGDMHMPLHLTGKNLGGNKVEVCWEGKETRLHIAWDDWIVEKAIRSTEHQYTKPLPGDFEHVEKNLRGAVYDPLIRKIIWAGVEGKWANEVEEWVSCPMSGEDTESEVRTTDNIWGTLRDFFLPGWFVRRGVDVPITDTGFICPYHWAAPISALNCELIWPKALESNRTSSRVMAPPSPMRCKRFPPVEEDEGEFLYELSNPDYMGPVEERMLLERFLGQGGIRLAAALNYIFEARTA